jgi:Xaa-Pro aminopeptidase
MKTDLDALMQARGIDALWIVGPADHNPAMVYFTGVVHVSSADLIKKRGEPPILFYNSMERDEAARTGLPTRDLEDYSLVKLLEQTGGDLLEAVVKRYQQMLSDRGLTSGRIALYGKVDAGEALAVFTALQKAMPGLEFVSERGNSLLLNAMATKSPSELEHIRRMGQVTVDVVGQVADFLTSHRVRDGALVKVDGSPLTIGEVKSRINLWLAERGAENPEGTIFAIGRDSAVPHSAGNPLDLLRLGQTIIFDIYPCEAGGGYFYDFTRTWCLGFAPDEALSLYEDVLSVYRQVSGSLRAGTPCKQYQALTCELFENRGHPTVVSNPGTQVGYVHGLGHGVGLNIHERPFFSLIPGEEDVLPAGAVVTIEPGLYYPERGLGMRLEDTYWVRPDGKAEVLAEYPVDLVLPVRPK